MVKPNSLEKGLQEGWTRATFVLRKDYLSKLKAVPYWDKGATKRLIIGGCVICLVAGVCFINIIQQRQQIIKSRMTEVTNSISHVASAVTAYNQEENTWPYCDNIVAIRTSLGVSISTNKINSITVTSPTSEEVIITATIKGIDSRVDGKDLTLAGRASERGILWMWGGTVPPPYVPGDKSAFLLFPTK